METRTPSSPEQGRNTSALSKPPINIAELASSLSWATVFAGAAAAGAVSLILLILGLGLGLSSISPWGQTGVSARTFGILTILWMALTQLIASGAGGYVAGRMGMKKVALPVNEARFQDAAHGFLSWAVASLGMVLLTTLAAGSIISGGVQAAAMAGGSAVAATTKTMMSSDSSHPSSESTSASTGQEVMNYLIDSLFRRNPTSTDTAAPGTASAPAAASTFPTTELKLEVSRIFLHNRATETLPPQDLQYVGRLISQQTGLSQQEAEKRASESYARMRENLQTMENAARDTADKARRSSASTSIWTFISMLLGAFFAGITATMAGRQRDA